MLMIRKWSQTKWSEITVIKRGTKVRTLVYTIIVALFKHSHKNGTRKGLLCSTHVEWYDDLRKKTVATWNSHSSASCKI